MADRPTNPFADETGPASGRGALPANDPFFDELAPSREPDAPEPRKGPYGEPSAVDPIGELDFEGEDFGFGAPLPAKETAPENRSGNAFAERYRHASPDPFGFEGPDFAEARGTSFGTGSWQDFARPDPGSPDPFGFSAPLARSLRADTESGIEKAFDLAAINPLTGAAAPLLWLAARLNESLPIEDVAIFRARVMDEVGRFEANALSRGAQPRLARMCRYALCATIDDIVLNTEWGRQTDWTRNGLVSSFYQETWGGERFFELLGQFYQRPEETIDALELLAICLSIGFVGKYRVVQGGGMQLARIRAELYRVIRRVRGPYERSLSPPFAPVETPYRAPRRLGWFWAAAAGILALLALVYLYWGYLISQRLDAASREIAAIAPAMPVSVASPSVPDVPDPIPSDPFAELTQVERIVARLPDSVDADAVEVARDGDRVVVRLLDASFPSGGDTLSEAEAPVVSAIAEALGPEEGSITVVGHTDNVPIANATASRNNLSLSADRAQSAARMLERFLTDPGRVSYVGRGADDPIAPNDTAEGRSRNRRVEFQIPAEDDPS